MVRLKAVSSPRRPAECYSNRRRTARTAWPFVDEALRKVNIAATLVGDVGSANDWLSPGRKIELLWPQAIADCYMHVERISNWNELESLAPAWNQLAQSIPFRSWQWLGSWWRHYGAGSVNEATRQELFVLAVRDAGGTPVAFAPWRLERQAGRANIVKFLGSGEVCTDHLTVLCRAGMELEAADAVADWLARARKTAVEPNVRLAKWDQLEFRGIADDDLAMNRLVDQLAERGALVDRRTAEHCWRLDLPACWEDYLRTLSKSHRKQLRRFQRRLFDGGRAVLYTAKTAAEFERAMDLLVDLHQRRRQSLGERGCFESPRFAAFLRDAARQFFELGQLSLCWLELDSRPIACEFQLLGEGTIYAYQSGIEPGVLDEEPGRLATLAILRAAVASGHRAYDLLRGDEAYKAHWRAQPRACADIRVWPGEGADWVRRGAWQARENMKYWVKGAWQWAGAFDPRGRAAPHVSPRQR